MNCPSIRVDRWQINSLTFQLTQFKSLLKNKSFQAYDQWFATEKSICKYWFNNWMGASVICHEILWNIGFAKILKSVQRQFQLKYVDFFLFQGEWGEIWKMHALWFETWILNRSASPESESGDLGANQLGKPWMRSWKASWCSCWSYDDPVADTVDIQIYVSWGTWLGEQWMNSWISDSDAQD